MTVRRAREGSNSIFSISLTIKWSRHGNWNDTLQNSAEVGVYIDHRGDENRGFVREELSDDSRLVRKGNDIRNCIKERRWGSAQRSP